MSSITKLLTNIMENTALPVTFGMSKWRENGSIVTQQAFDRVMEVLSNDSFDNSRTSGEGRIRPSLIGDVCERKHLFSYMGLPKLDPSDSGLDVMNAGTWGHYRWQLAGLSAGWLSDIEIQVEHSPWKLKGAMDGMLSDGSGFELKTVNSRKFAKILKDNAPLEEHLMQVHAYMRALDLSYFSIVYENRDSANWKEFRVPRMPYIDLKLDTLMENLDRHIDKKTLPFILEGCKAQTGTSWTYCDWKDVCPTAQWKENNV